MTDNRLPLLLEAAMDALVAITDVGVEWGEHAFSPESVAYLFDRKEETGMSVNERLEAAHGKLQQALKLFTKELNIEEAA